MTQLRERHLVVKLILDRYTFPETGANEKIIKNLAMQCTISKASGLTQASANMVINGMKKGDIDELSRINTKPALVYNHYLEIYAGYDSDLTSSGLPPLIYRGQISSVRVDYNNPNRPLSISAIMGVISRNELAAHINLKGRLNLVDVYQNLARQMGLNPVLNNITGTLKNPTYSGSAIHQAQQIAHDYNHQLMVDDNDLLVAGRYDYLRPGPELLINQDYGLLGYPIMSDIGCSARVVFSPRVQMGRRVNLQTYNTPLQGQWFINGLTHSLDNMGPSWESSLSLNYYLQNLGVNRAL